jgi:hypothetical protein
MVYNTVRGGATGARLEKRAMISDAKPSNIHDATSSEAWKIHVGHQIASPKDTR